MFEEMFEIRDERLRSLVQILHGVAANVAEHPDQKLSEPLIVPFGPERGRERVMRFSFRKGVIEELAVCDSSTGNGQEPKYEPIRGGFYFRTIYPLEDDQLDNEFRFLIISSAMAHISDHLFFQDLYTRH